MLLTSSNLVHYILARGMVDQSLVVDGPLQIVDFGRRNRHFKAGILVSDLIFAEKTSSDSGMNSHHDPPDIEPVAPRRYDAL